MVLTMDRYIERRGDTWWVANPAQPAENFADKWNEEPERMGAFVRWLQTLRAQVAAASRMATGVDARRSIVKGFQLEATGNSVVRQAAPATVPPLGDRGHSRSPRWPLRLSHRCSVRGWIHPSVKKGRRLWELTDRSVPKGVGLRFEASTNVAPPFRVFWQIVNTGSEARAAGGLRGDFDKSDGSREGVRWESTAYAGTHSIEAFVVKDAYCVARSGPQYVRIRAEP
jgi:hypothetical protein